MQDYFFVKLKLVIIAFKFETSLAFFTWFVFVERFSCQKKAETYDFRTVHILKFVSTNGEWNVNL